MNHSLYSKQEKQELLIMIKETIHFRMITEILTFLPEEKHEWFLDEYQKLPHKQTLLEKLGKLVEDIEDKIRQAGERIKTEILEEMERE